MTKRSLALLIAIGAVSTVLMGSLQSKLFSDEVTLEESDKISFNRISDTDTYVLGPEPAVPSMFYVFYDKKEYEEMIRITSDYKEICINPKFYRYKGQDNHGWTIWERKEK